MCGQRFIGADASCQDPSVDEHVVGGDRQRLHLRTLAQPRMCGGALKGIRLREDRGHAISHRGPGRSGLRGGADQLAHQQLHGRYVIHEVSNGPVVAGRRSGPPVFHDAGAPLVEGVRYLVPRRYGSAHRRTPDAASSRRETMRGER
jgi:hypothetical protein